MPRPHPFANRKQRREERRAQRRQDQGDPNHRPRKRVVIPLICAAGAVAAAAVGIRLSCTTCYTVDVNGEPLAVFQSKATCDAAISQAETRASQILNSDYSFDQVLTIRPSFALKSQLAEVPEVTESIMDTIPELEHVYTLSIDGVIVGAAKQAETITQALNLVKEHYTTPDTVSLEVTSQVDVRYQYLPIEAGACTAESLAELMLTQSPRTFSYTIQEEDTLESLTAYFSMSPERLMELNPDQDLLAQPMTPGPEAGAPAAPDFVTNGSPTGQLTPVLNTATGEVSAPAQAPAQPQAQPQAPAQGPAQQPVQDPAQIQPPTNDPVDEEPSPEDPPLTPRQTPLQPGLTITIEQPCPRLVVTTVEEYTLDRVQFPEAQTTPDNNMFTGEQRILEDGTFGEERVLTRAVKRGGLIVDNSELRSVVTTEAKPLLLAIGTRGLPQLPNGCMFMWPVQGRITSDYGPRILFGKSNFHRGVDIAAPMGTAISAAADGVVYFTGPKGSYGNLVVLSHANGYFTYYGHCSKILVSPGQRVSQGQTIAAVGSTGRSTGPHCHFEVRYQGSCIDPLQFLPGSNNAPARVQIPLDPHHLESETPMPPVQPEKPKPPVEPEQPTPPPKPPKPPQPPAPPEPPTPPEPPEPPEPPVPPDPGPDVPPETQPDPAPHPEAPVSEPQPPA